MKKVKIYKTNGDIEEINTSIKKINTTSIFLIIYFEDGSETCFILSNIFKFDYIPN
jgi:hypothetical protein